MFSNAALMQTLAVLAALPSTLAAPIASAGTTYITSTFSAPIDANIACSDPSDYPTSITASNIPTFIQEWVGTGTSMTLSPSDPIIGANVVEDTIAMGLFYDTDEGNTASINVDTETLNAGFMAIFNKCAPNGQKSITGGGGVSEVEVDGQTIKVGWVIRVGGDLNEAEDGWKSE